MNGKVSIRRLLMGLALAATLGFAGPAAAEESETEDAYERYVRMDVVSAPIINRNRIRGRVELELTLEVLDESKSDSIHIQLPRVHAAFVSVT